MRKSKCNICVFGDKCRCYKKCEHFYPITEDGEEAFYEEMIENTYLDFQDEWNDYVREYAD